MNNLDEIEMAIRDGLTASNLTGDTYGVPESLQSIATAIKSNERFDVLGSDIVIAATKIAEGLQAIADAISDMGE